MEIRGQYGEKTFAFRKFHRVTHQSDGGKKKHQSTAAPLIRINKLLGSGPSVILCMEKKLE